MSNRFTEQADADTAQALASAWGLDNSQRDAITEALTTVRRKCDARRKRKVLNAPTEARDPPVVNSWTRSECGTLERRVTGGADAGLHVAEVRENRGVFTWRIWDTPGSSDCRGGGICDTEDAAMREADALLKVRGRFTLAGALPPPSAAAVPHLDAPQPSAPTIPMAPVEPDDVRGELPIESPRQPLTSAQPNGLTAEQLRVESDRVAWYDFFGEPALLVASLLAQRLGHPIALSDIRGGNGHLVARWERVEPDGLAPTGTADALRAEVARLRAEITGRAEWAESALRDYLRLVAALDARGLLPAEDTVTVVLDALATAERERDEARAAVERARAEAFREVAAYINDLATDGGDGLHLDSLASAIAEMALASPPPAGSAPAPTGSAPVPLSKCPRVTCRACTETHAIEPCPACGSSDVFVEGAAPAPHECSPARHGCAVCEGTAPASRAGTREARAMRDRLTPEERAVIEQARRYRSAVEAWHDLTADLTALHDKPRSVRAQHHREERLQDRMEMRERALFRAVVALDKGEAK